MSVGLLLGRHMIDSFPLNLPREETSMQFGLFMMPLHPPERSFVDSYERDLAQIVLADRLGYHEVWIGEHLTERWENAPAPELLIAQALIKTEKIVLATGVTLLALHNPVEVAHRIAMLDHLGGDPTRRRARLHADEQLAAGPRASQRPLASRRSGRGERREGGGSPAVAHRPRRIRGGDVEARPGAGAGGARAELRAAPVPEPPGHQPDGGVQDRPEHARRRARRGLHDGAPVDRR